MSEVGIPPVKVSHFRSGETLKPSFIANPGQRSSAGCRGFSPNGPGKLSRAYYFPVGTRLSQAPRGQVMGATSTIDQRLHSAGLKRNCRYARAPLMPDCEQDSVASREKMRLNMPDAAALTARLRDVLRRATFRRHAPETGSGVSPAAENNPAVLSPCSIEYIAAGTARLRLSAVHRYFEHTPANYNVGITIFPARAPIGHQ